MADPGGRRLLPQTGQMQTFAFAPPNLGPRENQKNYVFVDEHNRHKRLKVMRACEGCRRRKIKCDAATTNTWPCSACIRLKLHCVPPTVNYDKDYASGGQGSSSDQPQDFDGSSGSGEDDYGQHPSIQQHLTGDSGSDQGYAGHVAYDETGRAYQTGPYMPQSSPQHEIPYDMNQAPRGDVAGYSYQQPAMYATSASQPMPGENGATWQQDQYAAMSLSGALGELKIDETGLAPYITRQKKSLAEAPALEEFEFNLPPTPISPGDKVRIPAELMPTDEQAMNYFNFFFQNIHPYVPVINRSYFFQQWDTNRDTISPLLLEAIFACSARLSDDPVQGAKWLALAGRHADSFMDVPRLSTLQAMLLVLKARESAPKRGYYYRSWMTVVTLVSMAKDLGLDEHYELHQAGKPCGSTLHDCITKTRVWQTLFVCEMMIGGPQGRFDMGVDPETVDLTIHPSPTLDESDFQISRQYTYFVSCVANIRRMNDVYGRVRKKPDWGSDPEFLQLNPRFTAWMHDLPQDLQVMFPPDSSPPWIPSHFIGNLNAYYNLSIIMLHRPQLAFHDSTGVSSTWRENMLQCYTAAKNMCRLQEAILQNFGLAGLLCMQRGINTAIYAVLTCTMLHLVAITSPDPEINYQAKEYFTRHMRILEQCVQSWPMPEMQAQVQALREAFSADITKPFTLKPSFPYDTPSPTVLQATSIPPDMQYRSHSDVSGHMAASAAAARANQMPYSPHPITPPISAGGLDPKGESPAQSLVMMASGSQRQQHPQQRTPLSGTSAPVHLEDPLVWNPTRIFDQWNTAFGTPAPPQPPPLHPSQVPPDATPPHPPQQQAHPRRHPHPHHQAHHQTHHPSSSSSTTSPPLTSLPRSSSTGTADLAQLQDATSPHSIGAGSGLSGQQLPQQQQHPGAASGYASAPPQQPQAFVAPSVSAQAWRDSVASVFEGAYGGKRRWDGGGVVGDESGVGGGGGGGVGVGKRVAR